MRKTRLTILLLVCLINFSLGQSKIDNPSIIVRGQCVDILKEIKDSTNCDSLAIQVFITYYKFENGISFASSQWRVALNFISKKENSQLFCTLKDSMRELDLIGNPIKDAEKRKLK